MILFRLALRSHRTGLIATALLGTIAGVLNVFAYVELAGDTPAARALFAQQMELIGRQLSYLLPNPVELETLAGYLVWRAFGAIVLIYAFWAVLAGTGAGRGDEDRGLVEHWLAAGVSRTRWLVTRAAALAVIAAASTAITFGATGVAAAAVGEPLTGGLALQALATWAPTVVVFAFSLGVSQLVATRRSASSLSGLVIGALFLVNSGSRSGLDAGPLRWVSPFYLYERNTPLLGAGSLDVAGIAAMLVAAVVLVVISVLAFQRRDLGGPLFRTGRDRTRPTARPSGDMLLRLPVLSLVAQQRAWIAGWALALAGLAAFLTSLTRTMVDALSSSNIPAMRIYFERAGIALYSDFVGVIWFSTLLLIISLFVAAQVNGWAADDVEGRLETILSAPVSRARIVIERVAAVLVAVAVVVAASSVAVYGVASANEIVIPADRFAVASAFVLPVAYAFAGVGHALVGWRPRLAVNVIAGVAATSYFIQQFVPLLGWPDWVKSLSLYALYGTPLSTDDRGGIVILLAIGIAGTAIALVVMRRRDVGR